MKIKNDRELLPDEKNEGIEVVARLRLMPAAANTEKAELPKLLRELLDSLDGDEVVVGLMEIEGNELSYLVEVREVENVADLEAQIAHIEEHSQAFEDHAGVRTSVRGYFADYGHIPDLYERLCDDLRIEPK